MELLLVPEVLEPWLPADEAPDPLLEAPGVVPFMSGAPLERPLGSVPEEPVEALDPLVDCAMAAPPMAIAPIAAAMVMSFIGSLLSAEIQHQLPATRHVPGKPPPLPRQIVGPVNRRVC